MITRKHCVHEEQLELKLTGIFDNLTMIQSSPYIDSLKARKA